MASASWTLTASARSVAEARRSVADFARDNGVPEPCVDNVLLAVSEAVTNAVVHAFRGLVDRGTVRVVATMYTEWIEVRVTDDGSGMAPRVDSPGLGLGLPLIQHLADEFDHRRPPNGVGTELWMRFGCSREGGK
jgi:anti-sigma regulatory factor (Ser/Thr protein kinase)